MIRYFFILAILGLGFKGGAQPTTGINSNVTVIGGDQDTVCDEIFISIEEMPQFPGGTDALLNYISSIIHYPKEELNKGIQGTVYVYFVIDKKGKTKDARVMRGVKDGLGLDKEALRVINSMPDWSIGRQNGRPACVQFTLPIRFKQ